MMKKSKKSSSKRISIRKKHKVIKKVKEHIKKKAKEAKKPALNKKRKVEKDTGSHDDWPSKEQELKALEERRAQRMEELEQKKTAMEEKAKKRKLGLAEDDDMAEEDNIANLASVASEKEHDFERRNVTEDISTVAKIHDHSERSFYKELVKVIEASDVILEVLDARDPLGTRSVDLEKMVMKSDPNKRVVLLLNKIDLIPREAVEKWLKYLRRELPAVAFKCSTQEQRSNLGWKSSKTTKAAKSTSGFQTSDCLGAETLIKLLKNYSRSHELKVSITVGIVGLPNVGKSSLINSLKRSHVVNVGSTPGLTRSMQEILLDKHVKLLDCPGVVMLKSDQDDTSIALRNCKRIEKLDDPAAPVKEIIKLCPAERLISLYKIPSYSSVDDFLHKVATKRGRLKKGGVVDIEAAARVVLHDWNEGKIPYFTLPPPRDEEEGMEATIVAEFSKEFNFELSQGESSFIGSLVSVDDFHPIKVPPQPPINLDEQMIDEGGEKLNEAATNEDCPMKSYVKDSDGAKANSFSAQYDKLYNAEGILNPRKLRAEKKRRKAEKAKLRNQMDADYDFKEDDHMSTVPSDDGKNGEKPMAGVES